MAIDTSKKISSVSYNGIEIPLAIPEPILQSKSIIPTTAPQTVFPDSGFDGLSDVVVNAVPTQELTVSDNGTYTPDVGKFFSSVLVDVQSGGGLPDGIAALDFGTYVKSSASNTSTFEVPHNLGVVPDFVFFYTPTNIATTYSMLAAMRGSIINWRNNYNSFYFYHANSTSTVTITNNSNATYGVGSFTTRSFKVASHSTSYYWRAGTYKYIAIKFS